MSSLSTTSYRLGNANSDAPPAWPPPAVAVTPPLPSLLTVPAANRRQPAGIFSLNHIARLHIGLWKILPVFTSQCCCHDNDNFDYISIPFNARSSIGIDIMREGIKPWRSFYVFNVHLDIHCRFATNVSLRTLEWSEQWT